MVFRRLLRKRWVLGVVFGLSLIYFLSSTLKHQEERTIRDRTLLEARDSDHHIQWKIKFILGNSSRQISQCRNSIQGKRLLTDELGNKNFQNIDMNKTVKFGVFNIYEYCVSCCLQPDKVLQTTYLYLVLLHKSFRVSELYMLCNKKSPSQFQLNVSSSKLKETSSLNSKQ
uniref:SREBP regulating gene protein n=1 Tax=Cyprinus carpio TaxID=7962 RepID=A0A8C1MRV6_CYPCA